MYRLGISFGLKPDSTQNSSLSGQNLGEDEAGVGWITLYSLNIMWTQGCCLTRCDDVVQLHGTRITVGRDQDLVHGSETISSLRYPLRVLRSTLKFLVLSDTADIANTNIEQ